jgi:hypothetical protein
MKMKIVKYFLIIVVTEIIYSFSIPKVADGDKIYWSKSTKLTWDDFKEPVPNTQTSTVAYTNSGYGYKLSYNEDSATFVLDCYFDKTKSWVKKAQANDFILKHEQGHFDITYTNSLRLRKTLKEHKFTLQNINDDVKKIVNASYDANFKEQELYDAETNHSIIKEKQEEWNKKIEKDINDLDIYSAKTIAVKLNK